MVLLWLGICQSVNDGFFLEFHCFSMLSAASAWLGFITIAPASMAEYFRKSLREVIVGIISIVSCCKFSFLFSVRSFAARYFVGICYFRRENEINYARIENL